MDYSFFHFVKSQNLPFLLPFLFLLYSGFAISLPDKHNNLFTGLPVSTYGLLVPLANQNDLSKGKIESFHDFA